MLSTMAANIREYYWEMSLEKINRTLFVQCQSYSERPQCTVREANAVRYSGVAGFNHYAEELDIDNLALTHWRGIIDCRNKW
jgi:hypothetical protein